MWSGLGFPCKLLIVEELRAALLIRYRSCHHAGYHHCTADMISINICVIVRKYAFKHRERKEV